MHLISILIIGLILGIKHALEPDHIIAVSTILSKTNRFSKTILVGLFWGIGHTITLFVVGIIVIIMKMAIPDSISMSLELFVGLMIIYLGIKNIYDNKTNCKKTSLYDKNMTKIKSIIIGSIHGLSGSAALVILTMSTVKTTIEAAIYILVFGIGTILGMQIFTTLIGVSFVISNKNKSINKNIILVTSILSIAFGSYYIYDIVVNEKIFILMFG